MEQFHREIIKSNGFVLIEYIDGRNNFFFWRSRYPRIKVDHFIHKKWDLRTIVKYSATRDCG